MLDPTSKTYNRETFHGGDLNWAKRNFGSEGLPWIDLSTGINPHAYPLPVIPSEIWERLPGSQFEEKLLDAAKHYYLTSKSADIVACPGTQSIVQLLPRLIENAEVAILSPTYAEHAKCWRTAGHKVAEVEDILNISETANIVVVVTPNNPTGEIYDINMLHQLQQRLVKRNGFLILDEAFMDVSPQCSYAPHMPSKGVLILKSFGKFFGLAGLRLGFAVGDKRLICKLREEFGPWAVSGPAAYVGTLALSDFRWSENTRDRLHKNSQKLNTMLTEKGLHILGGTALYTLVQKDNAYEVFRRLCENRILTRPFPAHPDLIRFGLPGTENQWNRFQNALDNC